MTNHTTILNTLLGVMCFISSASAMAENDLPNTCRLLDAYTAKSILYLDVEPLEAFKDLPEDALEIRSGTRGIKAEPGVIFSTCARYAALKSPSRNPGVILGITKYLDKKAAKAARNKESEKPKKKDTERLQIDGIDIYIFFQVEGNGDNAKHMAQYIAFKENAVVAITKFDLPEKWTAKLGRLEVLEFIKQVFGVV